MNRLDEIKAAARDVATNVHMDPVKRDAMADDLIRLCCLIIKAVGKDLACHGESEMNEALDWTFELDPEDSPEDTADKRAGFEADRHDAVQSASALYLAGERMQTGANWVIEKAGNADLERYSRPNGNEWCVCGHHPDCHGTGFCNGVMYNGHECRNGRCDGFTAKMPEPVWTHVDRRPEALQYAAVVAVQDDPFRADGETTQQLSQVRPVLQGPCNCIPIPVFSNGGTLLRLDHERNCQSSGPACPWVPGEAAPSCDWSPDCSAHGHRLD
jgi:hypothetical protein